MELFSEPLPVFLALLSLFLCFAIPMGGTYLIIRKTGLWAKMQEEIRAKKLENDEKEKTA
jgi:hypothetical protein